MIVPLEKPSELTTNWQFAQVELAGSHYAAICRESNGGGEYLYFRSYIYFIVGGYFSKYNN